MTIEKITLKVGNNDKFDDVCVWAIELALEKRCSIEFVYNNCQYVLNSGDLFLAIKNKGEIITHLPIIPHPVPGF